MRTLIALLFSIPLLAQVQIYSAGSISGGGNYGFGVSATYRRVSIGAEQWQLNGSPDVRVVLVGVKIIAGLHIESGAGYKRATKSIDIPVDFPPIPIISPWCRKNCIIFGYKDPIVSIPYTVTQWEPVGIAGTYYKIGNRLFAKVGYRRMIVVDDHDTNQVYVGVGVTF